MRKAFLLLSLVFLVSCQTPAVERFSTIQPGMIKDEVLQIVGAPNRTEFAYSKEKWAYRFWTGPDKDVEDLKQVTFVQGKVTEFGPDKDEIQRLKDIRDFDFKRAALAKAKEKLDSTRILKAGETEAEDGSVSAIGPVSGPSSEPISASDPSPSKRSGEFKTLTGTKSPPASTGNSGGE